MPFEHLQRICRSESTKEKRDGPSFFFCLSPSYGKMCFLFSFPLPGAASMWTFGSKTEASASEDKARVSSKSNSASKERTPKSVLPLSSLKATEALIGGVRTYLD